MLFPRYPIVEDVWSVRERSCRDGERSFPCGAVQLYNELESSLFENSSHNFSSAGVSVTMSAATKVVVVGSGPSGKQVCSLNIHHHDLIGSSSLP